MWNCEKRVLQTILLILAASIQNVQSLCNECQPLNSVACHGENVFSLCINGTATRNYITCPDQYICTSDKYTCYPKETALASCQNDESSQCGICNVASKTFSCISHTKIAFCFGNDLPDYTRTANCPTGFVCDISNTVEFCSNAIYVQPSCDIQDNQPPGTEEPTTTEQTTTTLSNTPRDPNTICSDAATSGQFPTDDTTCTQYILCYQLPNSIDIKGLLINCPAQMYFDPAQRFCIVNKPESCDSITTTVNIPETEVTTEEPTTNPITPTIEPTSTVESTTTVKPTTTTTDEPTTTEESTTTVRTNPRDPDTICADAGASGSFPFDDDTTCTQYIYCYQLTNSADFLGTPVDCPALQYFDPVQRICTVDKPEGCDSITTTVNIPETEVTTEEPTTNPIDPITPTLEPTSTVESTTTVEPTTTIESTTTTEAPTTTDDPTTTEEATVTVEPTTTTEEPTTTNDPTTTISSAPRDPDTICADAGTTGDFPIDDDTTCTQYIMCYHRSPNSPDLNAIERNCPAQMYFDPVERFCTVDKPESCDSFTRIEESTTTTEMPPRDANAICVDGGMSGNFPYDNDTICTHYILCHKPNSNSETIVAYPDYKCPSSTPFFDPVIRSCTASKPAGCA